MALEGLKGLIKGLESQKSWQAQRQFRLVLQHWPKSVGFAVARKTRPVGIQRGTLYVATETAAWAQTLFYERSHILRKLNRYQRQPLKAIRFSTAQWAQSASSASRSLPPSKAIAQHPSYIGPATDPATDPATGITAQAPLAASIPPNSLPTSPSPTPTEAFQQWATLIQHQQRYQSLCPECDCRCPPGEIHRWTVCALCAAKKWR
ncbi:MAG: DUF721 domain-containing protein [Phormidesmis sp.]